MPIVPFPTEDKSQVWVFVGFVQCERGIKRTVKGVGSVFFI